MKLPYLTLGLLLLGACVKKIGKPIPPDQPQEPKNVTCKYQSGSTISYSIVIEPIILNNCGKSCHSSPGSGGINLDSYSGIKANALSGALLPVISNTNSSSTMMPPPPQKHLDSCDIKAVRLWIDQGCLNN